MQDSWAVGTLQGQAMLEWFEKNLPEDMCVIGSGGFAHFAEFLNWLMGYETLCYALYDQRDLVTFDAFFENTMFHEVAHGLGLNNTINGGGTVRSALKEQYSALEEGISTVEMYLCLFNNIFSGTPIFPMS